MDTTRPSSSERSPSAEAQPQTRTSAKRSGVTAHTQGERAAALELYREHGPAEAARRTGIASATIRQWAKRSGVTASRGDTARANVTAAQLTWAQRRGELTVSSAVVAAELLEKMREAKARDARDFAAAYAFVVDRAQLLDGAATARTETRDLTSIVDDAIDQLLAGRSGD